MKRSLRRSLGWCLAILAFLPTACDRPATGPSLQAVGEPIDLEHRDAQVVEQYRQLRAQLDAASSPEAPSGEHAAAWLDLGTWFHAFRDYELATLCYQNGAVLEPDELRWPYYLGRIHDTLGEVDAARDQLERALALQPRFVPGLVILGELELRDGNVDVARRHFEKVIEIAPRNARAHQGLAEIALDAGEPETAIGHLEAGLEQQPDATALHYSLGLALRAAGDPQAAAEHFERAQIGGNDDRVRVDLRDPLMERVQKVSRGRANTRVRQAEKLFDLKRYDEAETLLREVIEDDDTGDLRLLLGLVHRGAGDIAAAITELQRAIELKPDLGAAHFQLGVLLARRGQPEQAERHYRAVLRLDPGHRHAGSRLGHLLRLQGRCTEATAVFERAIDVHRSQGSAHFGLVACLVKSGAWAEARERAEAGLQLQPGAHALRHLLARLLASAPDATLRDGTRALAMARVQADTPVGVQHVETLAMAHAELGQFDDAVRWQQLALNAAVRADPTAASSWIAKRLERYKAGRPNRAIWAEGEPETLSGLPPAAASQP